MTKTAHLWAIMYDDPARADQVRHEISKFAWGNGNGGKCLILLNIVVVVRDRNGAFSFDRKPFPGVANIMACATVGFLAGLVAAAPLSGAVIGAIVGGAGTIVAAAASAGITLEFIKEVEGLMEPGTSALFVLDDQGDMDMILHAIRGLGGTIVKTNVDLERAKLIQSTLAAPAVETKGQSKKQPHPFGEIQSEH
jgi:uncharacterized membrane protein